MHNAERPLAVILSGASSREATCQLLELAERGGVREGMLVRLRANRGEVGVLARIAEIIPYNAFYGEGDAWSEARRKGLTLPEQVARQYEICKLELLMQLEGHREVVTPPYPGDQVFPLDVEGQAELLFGVGPNSRGVVWYGSLVGYDRAPIPLNTEKIPMHLAIFGVTGSGKSFDVGALLEKFFDIPVTEDSRISFPTVIVDAHGDYSNYAEHAARAQLGAVTQVTRFVFPEKYRQLQLGQVPPFVRPIGIDLDRLVEPTSTREVAELVVRYYKGGAAELSELQIHGLQAVMDNLVAQGFTVQRLFTDSFPQLVAAVDQSPILSGPTRDALDRALQAFRELDTIHTLFSADSRLKDAHFVDDLTRTGQVAILDFSADGAPGVDLPTKQLVMTYIAARLFREFTRFKIVGQDRFALFVIEEAQNFAPDPSYPLGTSLAHSKLSAIATQGRKFGLSLCLVSQRPSFVDRVVLSMCNSFFIHRVSPEDVSYVKSVTGGLPASLAARLTRLSQGEVIVAGEMNTLPFPLLIRVPRSDRRIPHVAGTTNVIDSLVRLRTGAPP